MKKYDSLKIAFGIPAFSLGVGLFIFNQVELTGFWQYFNYFGSAILLIAIGVELLSPNPQNK